MPSDRYYLHWTNPRTGNSFAKSAKGWVRAYWGVNDSLWLTFTHAEALAEIERLKPELNLPGEQESGCTIWPTNDIGFA